MKSNSIKYLLFVLFIGIGLCGNAQKRLIPSDIKSYTLRAGDTIIFNYSSYSLERNAAIPKYYSYKTDYTNRDCYLEGYMCNSLISVKQKRRLYNGFVYHGYLHDFGGYYELSTPISEINNKKLIVISMNSFRNNLSYYDHDIYYETSLLNTAFNDTLFFRCTQFDSKTTKPNKVVVPKLERLLKKRLIGKEFYLATIGNGKESDRVILDENGVEFRYSKYTITNCVAYFEGEYWTPIEKMPHIIIWYQDDNGKTYEFDDYETTESDSRVTYTESELNATEIRWQEKKKNMGHYHFSVIKVDKPKSQNVKKGKLTENSIYEDNIISIKWNEDRQVFNFLLKNLTSGSMKLLWDEALIVNFDGFTERVLHKGSEPDALNQAQQPSIIPSLAQLSDYFWSESYYGGKRLVDGYGGTKYREEFDGKQMRLILPIQVENAKYTYTFTFELKWKWSFPELRE